MTAFARVLFDECLSAPIVESLIKPLQFLGADFEVAHQFSVYGQGAKDTEWIPRGANDGWCVVTADRGKKSRVEEKLPLLCEAYGVPHILMAPGFSKRAIRFRMIKVQELWPDILTAARGPAGARYSMQLCGATAVRIVQTKCPTADDIAKTQQFLIDMASN